MYHLLRIIAICLIVAQSVAQPQKYSTANAHSHNDFEQKSPFYAAYSAGFGSIEADIYLVDGQLLVGHEKNQLTKERTLQALYLKPLAEKIQQNHGQIFSEKNKPLNILIDCKTDGVAALDVFTILLKKYNPLITNRNLRFVISGNRPPETDYHLYPDYIQFDGRLGIHYTPEVLSKIAIISDYFGSYSKWNGEATLPEEDRFRLMEMIKKVHEMKKPIRFWGSPDTPTAWEVFKQLGVDYINTDKIAALDTFLEKR
jgi:alkaline phosphatase